jgi:uncharacterized protein
VEAFFPSGESAYYRIPLTPHPHDAHIHCMNRLKTEKSPYLRQHASNPVEWHPWGEEALGRAAAEDKPLFISIGYATCHWCHVMAHECFEDNEVALLLNRDYIPIKIDREELPHIDAWYMTAFQILNGGGGGWPLTIFATSDARPFAAATYIPKNDRAGRNGMTTLLPRISALWTEERARVEQTAAKVASRLDREDVGAASGGEGVFSPGVVNEQFEKLLSELPAAAEKALLSGYDGEFGGFGAAPKFPSFHTLLFLLRRYAADPDPLLLEKVERTLGAIRRGGIYDQLGFGVHRYAVDREWKVPHFEKMLYDQAGFLLLTGELFQLTGNESYRRMGEEIYTYLTRDMLSPEGGFYSAEDADSEGKEGRFYLWSRDALEALLDSDEFAAVEVRFGIRAEGNFESENILHTVDESRRLSDESRLKLLQSRSRRPRPFRDTKIMADWNGFAVAALARGARVFQNRGMLETAEKTMDFILTTLGEEKGGKLRLFHRYCDGELQRTAFLDDYAWVLMGLIELYQSSFRPERLSQAFLLYAELREKYALPGGGFSVAERANSDPGGRSRPLFDGAYPSGNSVMLHNLKTLFQLTGDPEYEKELYRLAGAVSRAIADQPSAGIHSCSAFVGMKNPSREIVVAGRADDPATIAILEYLQRHALPDTVLLFRTAGEKTLPELIPFTAAMKPSGEGPAVYICRDRLCGLPVSSLEELKESLESQP